VIDRSKLLDLSGRGRTEQYRLAEQYGIRGFSAPAGGCLLTDENFSEKLRDLFADQPTVSPTDIRLLTLGRHFKVSPGVRVVLGRDRRENELLDEIAGPGYHFFEPLDFMGPVAVVTGELTDELKTLAGRLIVSYSKKFSGPLRTIRMGNETFPAGPAIDSPDSVLKRIGAH